MSSCDEKLTVQNEGKMVTMEENIQGLHNPVKLE